jgi:hypothetical protein
LEREKKPEEKFLEYVHRIDFTKKTELKSETPEKPTEWIWSKVDENIAYLLLLSLLNNKQTNKQTNKRIK